jgi:hypothetical protein
MNYALPNEIFIGSEDSPLYYYDNDSLILNSLKGTFNCDLISNEIPVDTFSFSVRFEYRSVLVYAPMINSQSYHAGYRDTDGTVYALDDPAGREAVRNYLRDLPYGTPVWWYCDGRLIAKGYIQTVERTSATTWKVTCMSGIGLLAEKDHPGGIYTGQSFEDVLADIVGGAFEYALAPGLAEMAVFGWIPYAKARENLHSLLFAQGVTVKRYELKDFIFQFPPNGVDKVVPDSRVALGGSVSANLKANEANVTEHSFLPLQTDEEVVLFDNTGLATADHLLVVFSEPMHDLAVSGTLTIDESHVNYAVVSGIGALTGKVYTHTRLIVTVSTAENGDAIRSKSVSDNCLINEANSQNAARRVLSYYAIEDTFKSKIMLTDEKPGDMVRIRNPFKDISEAHIEKMDILATSVIGASMELTEGFNAQWVGNNFQNAVLIDADGTFTVPAGVTRIRVVLIQGGSGGQGGQGGHKGVGYFHGDQWSVHHEDTPWPMTVIYYEDQPLYEGGEAGAPGSAGKIFSVDIDVTPGDVATFSIGAAGTGGAAGVRDTTYGDYGTRGQPGTAGTHTTMSLNGRTYTSGDGAVSPTGYLYLFGNLILGKPGEAGHKGGAGGQTNVDSLYGWQYASGLPGGSVGQWAGGAGGSGAKYKWWPNVPDSDERAWQLASGGGGGGAAWGHAGKNTHYRAYPETTFTNNARVEHSESDRIYLAYGGDGASADPPDDPTYGSGGGGGNGGGSGGSSGGGKAMNPVSDFVHADGGNGGEGSRGGNGGPGCAIVYY